MKISKLFHWLYALVMLLPILAIGVTCLISTFNKNSNASYQNTTFESVETYNDLGVNNWYRFNSDRQPILNNNGTYFKFYFDEVKVNYTISNYIYNANAVSLYSSNNLNVYTIYFYDSSNVVLGNVSFDITQNNINFDFHLTSYQNEANFDKFKNSFSKVTYSNVTDIKDTFYYSVDKVTNSNLFNWAYDSFLVVPFTYIVNLFSMPTNSPIVMLLSYWLAISIIWLVFDLIMYIPLLVHRWLDKGVIE